MALNFLSGTGRKRAAYERRFFHENKDDNLFLGDFGSFDAARAHIPAELRSGYDNAQGAKNLYSHQIYNWDYPALFWIGQALAGGATRVFDLGGHVGIKYYAFRRMLNYPADLRWTVCDVPNVVASGRELAVQREASAQLSFTTEIQDASGCDVLYASGSLQYLPQRISEIIAGLPVKPRRIVLNTTAVHPERTIYTLNSIGFAVCPYRIQHHDHAYPAPCRRFTCDPTHIGAWGRQNHCPRRNAGATPPGPGSASDHNLGDDQHYDSAADGEYWGRVIVTSTPVAAIPTSGADTVNGIQTNLSMRLQLDLPVIIRKGTTETGIVINGARAHADAEGTLVLLDMKRVGNSAYRGTLTGVLKRTDGSEVAHIEEQYTTEFSLRKRLRFPKLADGTYALTVESQGVKKGGANEAVLQAPPLNKAYELTVAGDRISIAEMK